MADLQPLDSCERILYWSPPTGAPAEQEERSLVIGLIW